MQGNREKVVTIVWFLFWGVLSSAWCATAALTLGATFDEHFYVRSGLQCWHEGMHRELLTQGTMPLAAEVQTLPLLVAEQLGGADPLGDFSDWLPIARLGTLVFWWLLLWASHQLAGYYGGIWAGRFAVALVASEPILLGHASLATTDIAFTACMLTLLVVFLGRREQADGRSRLVLPAIWVTMALLAKASALMFVPVCLGMVELHRLWVGGWRPGRTIQAWEPALASLRDLAKIGLLGTILLFVVCPRALRGLLFQIRHNSEGHGSSFLLGEASPEGFRHYFAAALAIKLSLPILILLAVTLLVRPRYWMNGALGAALALLALTPIFRVQIGVRFVLPIAVLAMVGAAAAVARWRAEEATDRRGAWALGFASLVVAVSLVGACQVWPHGICHTNQLFGGTSQGYMALSDSNYDWGQGLRELADWQKKHPEAPLHLCYFGTDPMLERLPVRSTSLAESVTDVENAHRGCFLAVSTNYVILNTPAAQHLRQTQPMGRTTTFLIYDFREPRTQAASVAADN